jgi:hypothetical protein
MTSLDIKGIKSYHIHMNPAHETPATGEGVHHPAIAVPSSFQRKNGPLFPRKRGGDACKKNDSTGLLEV